MLDKVDRHYINWMGKMSRKKSIKSNLFELISS